MYSRFVSGILIRRSNSLACENFRNVHFFPQHYNKVHSRFKWCGQRINVWLREQSIQVMRACTRQFEFIAAQRIRRSIQLYHLYTRLWDEVTLKEFIRLCRQRIGRKTKNFLIGTVGVTIFDWENERISDCEINR